MLLAKDKPVLNGLVVANDVLNSEEDEEKPGAVFVNKDEVLAENAEPLVCPKCVLFVDDGNGLELAADVLLNDGLNIDVEVEPKPVEAKVEGLAVNGFGDVDGNGLGVVWVN